MLSSYLAHMCERMHPCAGIEDRDQHECLLQQYPRYFLRQDPPWNLEPAGWPAGAQGKPPTLLPVHTSHPQPCLCSLDPGIVDTRGHSQHFLSVLGICLRLPSKHLPAPASCLCFQGQMIIACCSVEKQGCGYS